MRNRMELQDNQHMGRSLRLFFYICRPVAVKLVATLIAVLALFSVATSAQAAITYRDKDSLWSDSANTLSLPMPTGTVEGDLMIATVTHDVGSTTLSAPAGWTLIQPASPGTEECRTRSWYRVAQSGESGPYEFNSDATNSMLAQIVTFYESTDVNVDGWTLEDSSYKYQEGSNSITSTSVTGVANSLLYLAEAEDDNVDVLTAPSGMTMLYEEKSGGNALATYYEFRGAGGVTKDITWDDSADELAAIAAIFSWSAAIFYSVGTDTSPLYQGDASASSGTLTLEGGPAADKIGVGDEVQVGSYRYYITRRNSSTEFRIQDSAASGGTPGDTNITFGTTSIEIYRAFNSLDSAASNSNDGSHLNTDDLVTGKFQLNWPCYKDGPDTPNDWVDIEEPWVTGPNNYIRVYTPTDESEVGESQRHDGTAGTGYRLAPSDSSGGYFNILFISTDNGYVRIDGIEISGENITNGENIRGILVNEGPASQDVRITNNLVYGLTNDTTVSSKVRGIYVDDTDNSKVFNNVIYNITNTTTDADSEVIGIESGTVGTTQYIYNNTIYNIKHTGTGGGGDAYGVYDSAGSTIDAKNNFVGSVDSTPGSEACFSGTFSAENYNISSDTSVTGPDSMASRTATDSSNPGTGDWVVFKDISTGWDFHLKGIGENDALDKGTDLSTSVTGDIDGDSRPYGSGWDIGADEQTPTTHYRSVGTDAPPLYNQGKAWIDDGVNSTDKSTVVFTGGASLPGPTAIGAVGTGDKLTIGGETLYILSRESATQVTLQSPAQNTYSDATYQIDRAYDDITAWETARQGDLAANNTIEVAVCYKDGPIDQDVEIVILGWTTGPNNYIRIWVPSGQRHDGTADSGSGTDGFVLRPNYTGGGLNLFEINEEYVRIEGIELDGSDVDAPQIYGFYVDSIDDVNSDVRFDKMLVHDIEKNTTDNQYTTRGIYFSDGTGRVTNSIVYNITSENPDVDAAVEGI
ncbi:MAG: hypothetical protein JSV84_17320, partial [Gemmatimonadota bacterium]